MCHHQIFDPAMCCSSGVCGVDVDPPLITFAADVDWPKRQARTIERFNLAQQALRRTIRRSGGCWNLPARRRFRRSW